MKKKKIPTTKKSPCIRLYKKKKIESSEILVKINVGKRS